MKGENKMKDYVMVETTDVREVFDEMMNGNEVMLVKNCEQYSIIGIYPSPSNVDLLVNKDRETVCMNFSKVNDDYFLYLKKRGELK